MKYFLIWLTGILIIPFVSFSQANFKKGFLVTLKGDTLSGFIDYREWHYNPKNITFKNASDNEIKIFTPLQIASFEIEGIAGYKTYNGLITLDPDKENNGFIDTTRQMVSIFLQLMQSGKNLSLFSYRDAVNVRYFIKRKANNNLKQLIEHGYEGQEDTLSQQNPYKSQLLYEADMYNVLNEDLQNEINGAQYSDEDIEHMIIKINGENNQINESKAKSVKFFVGAGADISYAKYSGYYNLANESSLLPTINMGADILNNPDVGKLIFRFELSLGIATENFQNNSVDGAITTYNSFTITLYPQVIYNFYNSSSLKIYGGAGIAGNYLTYKNSSYLNSFYFSVPVRAGVVFNNRIELFVKYFNYNAVNSTSSAPFSIKTFKIQPGINYLF